MSSVIGSIIGIGLGILLIVVVNMVLDRRRAQSRFIDQADPRPRSIPMYCADCGKGMVSMRSQDGFDPKTGEPRFAYARACPDATQNPAIMQSRAYPMCGHRTLQGPMPQAHNHTDPEATSVECPVCIDAMFENGVLRPDQVVKLYSQAGVASASTKSEDWAHEILSGYQRGDPLFLGRK